MDSELKKTSVRANRLEKKRFEMTMSAFESAKRNVAVDMKKSQLDFTRRLKRYKDRQREIMTSRSQEASGNMEEFVLKQLTRRSHMHRAVRPQTSPMSYFRHRGSAPEENNSSERNAGSDVVSGDSSSGGGGETGRSSMIGVVDTLHGTQDDDEDEDFAKLSHCRRSKIDLRPCTAWSVASNRHGGKAEAGNRSAPNMRLLQLRGGSLGTPARQVRYLDDEEIEERCMFYRFLLDGYRQLEHERLELLNGRVDEFCGKKRQSSCPRLVGVGLVSLPKNVPPILRHALSARVSRTDAGSQQLQRMKIH
ncbi:hypothetical protein BaRGS_00029306 [Batillaria attramentaria]|uniref:Uncharacterized protein n=1 Tax=Batillaria attramentaria TaxID=370345 RepID=A0ABD0JXT3_9CAEN|nr:hypothetical protein BaRGS_008218 [Batillaria attramentaria]